MISDGAPKKMKALENCNFLCFTRLKKNFLVNICRPSCFIHCFITFTMFLMLYGVKQVLNYFTP